VIARREAWNWLPLTRQWVADYQEYGVGPKPEHEDSALREPPAEGLSEWLKANPCPDLQILVRQWGGYDKIASETWAEYDRAMAEWQWRRIEGRVK
jgi:hypothetical protein